MGIMHLGLHDDFDLITPQTRATASLSLQLDFLYILHLILRHISSIFKHEGSWLATNNDSVF